MSTTKTATDATKEAPTFNEIMNKAAASAVRGGTAGAVAMGANVACLMWMRTTVSLSSLKSYMLALLKNAFTISNLQFLSLISQFEFLNLI